MKKKEKTRYTIFEKIGILVLVYPIGALLALFFILFRILGRIRILHPERFPHYQENLIVFANHPGLREPIILPVMCYREYLCHPFTLLPISTPSKKNYYDLWYWRWLLKFTTIPIDRSNQQERSRAFRLLKRILVSGGIAIIFGEGGRTEGGKSSPTVESDFFHSPKKKKKLRPISEGAASLARMTEALIVPVWVEYSKKASLKLPDRLYYVFLILMFFLGFWNKMTIKIGKPLRFKRSDSRERITQKLVTTLLELADEEE